MKLFSNRETRALTFLLPLVVVTVWIVVKSFDGHEPTEDIGSADSLRRVMMVDKATAARIPTLKPFDPNTVTYAQLRDMGVDKRAAVSIIRYRSNGKVFRIKEDVALTYGISDSLYFIIEPYIVIDKRFGPRESTFVERQPLSTGGRDLLERRNDTLFMFDPNTVTAGQLVDLGFSPRQADVVVRYVSSRGGVGSVEEFGECYVIDSTMLERLRPYVSISVAEDERGDGLLELNGADSAALTALRGIGGVSAQAIVEYRRRLGGYCSVEQLKDLRVITEKNFEKIIEQIRVDSCKIQKIDINFATSKELAVHPYLTPQRIRKILKTRQIKGGWKSIGEMIDDNTLTRSEADRLAPYLCFVVSE